MSWLKGFITLVILLGVVFLLRVIANTAGKFFSPTLQHFADATKFPDHLGELFLLLTVEYNKFYFL